MPLKRLAASLNQAHNILGYSLCFPHLNSSVLYYFACLHMPWTTKHGDKVLPSFMSSLGSRCFEHICWGNELTRAVPCFFFFIAHCCSSFRWLYFECYRPNPSNRETQGEFPAGRDQQFTSSPSQVEKKKHSVLGYAFGAWKLQLHKMWSLL